MSGTRIAILDMYEGHANQGMRCIEALTQAEGLEMDVFDVRSKNQFPFVGDYHLFLSTGGPGDPHECETKPWGEGWRTFLSEVRLRNSVETGPKRHLFLICHSYQMACITWGLADVTQRRKPAFGIYPLDKTAAGTMDPLLQTVNDPFWVIDSREWQVVHPNHGAMVRFGAQVIAIEKERPHVPLERAAMAIRFTPEIVGTQFHPEADESGMQAYLDDPTSLEKLAGKHGLERIEKIKENLGDPTKVNATHANLLPSFIRHALGTTV